MCTNLTCFVFCSNNIIKCILCYVSTNDNKTVELRMSKSKNSAKIVISRVIPMSGKHWWYQHHAVIAKIKISVWSESSVYK